jgi:hypothetical protein
MNSTDDLAGLVHGVVQSEPGLEPPLNQVLNQGGFVQPNALNPRFERVRQKLREKASFNDIISDVWGVKGKGGEWQQASVELREILAELAGGTL